MRNFIQLFEIAKRKKGALYYSNRFETYFASPKENLTDYNTEIELIISFKK